MLFPGKGHFVELPSQPFVGFVRIADDLRRVAFLTLFEFFGFVTYLSPAITVGRFSKKTPQM